MEAIEHLAQTLPLQQACDVFDFPRSSFYRLRQPKSAGEKRPRPTPARALSETERATVLALLDGERFQDNSPREVYAILLDETVYHCSVSTMYRVLREQDEVRERRKQAQHPVYTKPELVAHGSQSSLVVGYYQTARTEQMALLLSVRHARHL